MFSYHTKWGRVHDRMIFLSGHCRGTGYVLDLAIDIPNPKHTCLCPNSNAGITLITFSDIL